MKKKFMFLWILSIAITCALTYHGTSKANSGLQSKGKIIYNDASTGEEIVIDTNDHTLLKNSITANATEILSLKEFVARQETINSELEAKDILLEEDIVTLNDNLEWKVAGFVQAINTSITIPSEYKELIIISTPNKNMQAAQYTCVPFMKDSPSTMIVEFWDSNYVSFTVNHVEKTVTITKTNSSDNSAIYMKVYYR